jgi:predicted ester cyclase
MCGCIGPFSVGCQGQCRNSNKIKQLTANRWPSVVEYHGAKRAHCRIGVGAFVPEQVDSRVDWTERRRNGAQGKGLGERFEQRTGYIVRQLFEEGLNRAQEAVIERLVGAEYVDAAGERGPNAFKQVMTRLHTACPDLTYVIDDMLSEGDRVAVRWHWTGTHRGPFRNIAPTERSLTNTGTAIFRVRDGKIVGAALETDRLGFLQSIGVVPPNEVLFKPSAPLAATAK